MTACAMFVGEPYDFAWCETHDTTFALGSTCPHNPDKKAAQHEQP